MSHCVAMYSSVPPPEHQGNPDRVEHKPTSKQEPVPQPDHVSKEQWERFQKLRERRQELCSKGRTQRVNTMRQKALETVSKELSHQDKQLLKDEGLILPSVKSSRKRKRHVSCDSLTVSHDALGVPHDPLGVSHDALGVPHDPLGVPHDPLGVSHDSSGVTPSGSGDSSNSGAESAKKWQELKQYLDPNPQLKEDAGTSSTQKTKLEEALDLAVEKGELEKAVAISDDMANRKFASQIATAFDCVEYAKKQKIAKEKKKKKLKWHFEQKQRWESKGNM